VDEDSEWSLEHLDVSYVQAKRSAELAVREHAQRGAPVIFAYPGFCYGPGDVYDSSSELVVRFLSGSLPAYVEGGHDAVDVRDAAAGLILAMERGVIGERYLLGGENVTTEQFFGLLSYITGRRAPRIRLTPAVAVGIARLAGHISKEPIMTREMALMSGRYWFYDDRKARTSLGYTSRPLEATLRDAVSWFTARERLTG
jgi:dihydroflavonol-4-reductase